MPSTTCSGMSQVCYSTKARIRNLPTGGVAPRCTSRSPCARSARASRPVLRTCAPQSPRPAQPTRRWHAAGTLPNLWVSSLSGVMSKQQNTFYRHLPRFPYDDKTAEYVTLALNLDAKLRVAVLWFREPSKELLDLYVQQRGDDRVKLVKVPMPPSPLCPECVL